MSTDAPAARAEPMIVTRTPLRISFLGGGTDYPDHFRKHGGQSLGTAINRYSYVTVKALVDLFEHSIRVGYSRTELVRSVDEIEHPAVRACLQFTGIDRHVEIDYVGDLPARTGLGSSSSFTVGLLHALHAFQGNRCSSEQLAAEAVHVEQQLMRERVGVQDQYLCAHGGFRHVRCAADGIAANVIPIPPVRLAELERSLMLLYTGLRRDAHQVLEEQIDNTRSGAAKQALDEMSRLVDEGLEILTVPRRSLNDFGALLHQSWCLKRTLSTQVSTAAIDRWYEQARIAGAIGGKLLGAGGGGFLLLMAPPDRQRDVCRAVPELRHVPFTFEAGGSQVLLHDSTVG
jgi:D-glycero-alpha-D-manno-heptose-7-phosphate kinase